MSTGRYPSGVAGRAGGPNLPYLALIALSLGVLVPFLVLGRPFTPKSDVGVAPITTGATTVATSSTTLAVSSTVPDTTTTSGATTTTAALTGAAYGEQLFNATCIACHGAGGVGVEGLGKPLTTSTFADGLTDEELLQFLILGRSDTDPLNTTGIAMPARGGNPSLTDADLADIVAYLRTLRA